MALVALKFKRGRAKANLSSVINWLEVNANDNTDATQFRIKGEMLQKAFDKYCEVQEKIEVLLNQNPSDEPDTEDFVLIEENYFKALAHIQNCIDKLTSNSLISSVFTDCGAPCVCKIA